MKKKTRNAIIVMVIIALALILVALLRVGKLAIVTETYAKFRTSDLGYNSDTAIAYTSSCGSGLTPYGYVTCAYCNGLGASGSSCMSATLGYTKIMDLPGTLSKWSDGTGNIVSLFQKNSDPTILVVCGFKDGRYAYETYDSDDSDKTKVSTSPIPSGSNEVACQITICTPEWTCSSWSNCINNQQTRTCNDIYNCGKLDGKPSESQSCTSVCMESSTQSCTASNSCTGTQTCLNNAWGDCNTNLNKCADNSCQVSCPTCTDTCLSLNKECGTQLVCGSSVNCGTCSGGYTCTDGKCVSNTPVITCGNNIIDSGEVCDGTNLDAKTCEYFSLISGTLRCQTDCLGYDLSSCQQSTIIPDCTPSWTCTDWSSCINNQQTRNCIDANSCGVMTGKPIETQACVSDNIIIEPIDSSTTQECTTGERCIGTNYYVCESGSWANKGEIGGKCGYNSPCEETTSKCVSADLYKCYNEDYIFDKTCDLGCEDGKCKLEKPVTQYLLIVIILVIIAGIIYLATRKEK